MKIFGIDISVWQKGMNLSTAKNEGVNFAIIRAGYTAGNKSTNKDSQFETNYRNAKNNGIKVGAYYYSKAINYAEGRKEAIYLYDNCLKGKQFEYPIYIDVEDTQYQLAAGKDNIGEAIKGFCETLESLGYYVGIYCNLNWANNHINYSELKNKYDFWLAAWNSIEPSKNTYSYGMWQFGGETNKIRINKIAGMVCDQNYAFKDYPKIMEERGLNGFLKKVEKPVIEIPIEKPKEESVIEAPIEKPVIETSNRENNIEDKELRNFISKIVNNILTFFINLFKKKN